MKIYQEGDIGPNDYTVSGFAADAHNLIARLAAVEADQVCSTFPVNDEGRSTIGQLKDWYANWIPWVADDDRAIIDALDELVGELVRLTFGSGVEGLYLHYLDSEVRRRVADLTLDTINEVVQAMIEDLPVVTFRRDPDGVHITPAA